MLFAKPMLCGVFCALAVCTTAFAQDSNDAKKKPDVSVTVVATRSARETLKTPASVDVIEMDQLQRQGVADAGDVVRYEPGVSIPYVVGGGDSFVPYISNGFGNYRIRGVQGNRVLLTIDGIRMPPQSNLSGGNGRDYFDPAVFSRVEILKGSGSTLYGSDAMGGLVAFETRSMLDELFVSERPWLFKNRLALNEVNDSINEVANFGVRSEPFYITVVNSYRTGHERKNDKGDIPANPVDFWSNHFVGKATFAPMDVYEMTFTLERFYRDTETELNTLERAPTPDGQAVPPRSNAVYNAEGQGENERTRLSLDFSHFPDEGWWETLDAKIYYQTSETNSVTVTQANPRADGPPLTRDRTDYIGFEHDSIGGDIQITKAVTLWDLEHALVAGIEGSMESGENAFRRVDLKPVENIIEKPGIDPSDLTRLDIYLQDVVETGNWLFQGGIRAGYYTIEPSHDPTYIGQPSGVSLIPAPDYENTAFSPSLAVQYELNDETVLWTRYARGIRNPSLENYVGFFDHGDFQLEPNPDLNEETSDSFDFGIKYGGEALTVEATAFYTFYEDFIVVAPIQKPDGRTNLKPQNYEKVDIYGVEMSVDYALEDLTDTLKGFSTGLKLNLTKGKDKTNDDNVDNVDPFSTVGYVAFDHPSGKWGARLSGVYRAKKDDHSRNFSLYVPPSSFVLDLTGYWQISEKVSFEAGIRNLLDRKYWIWPNVDNVDHNFNSNKELATQPGINAFAALNVAF